MNLPLNEQNIIKILGIESLQDDRKIELVNKLGQLANKRLLVRILESLDATKKSELETLLDGTDPAKLDQFIADNIPNLNQWLEEEVTKIKQEMADLANKVE